MKVNLRFTGHARKTVEIADSIAHLFGRDGSIQQDLENNRILFEMDDAHRNELSRVIAQGNAKGLKGQHVWLGRASMTT